MDLPAQGTASLAVDDFYRTETGSESLIEESFNIRQGLTEVLPMMLSSVATRDERMGR